MKKTVAAKKDSVERKWYVIDAKEKVLGRMATRIADIIRGKDKPDFTPHVDTGDFVIVVNASQIVLTGTKWEDKNYYWHTGYPGGIRSITAQKLRESKPEDLIYKAVRGMLPKNRLSRQIIKKLKVYDEEGHPHEAQMPTPLEF